MDKIVIIIIGAVILAGAGFWVFQSIVVSGPTSPIQTPEGILLFFGEGCPHCKNVEDFLVENKIDEKVKITRMEVPFNGKTSSELENNAALLLKLAKICNLDASNGISIPFLYDGKDKCILGDQPAIEFFKEQTGTK